MEDEKTQRDRITDPKYRPGEFMRRSRRASHLEWDLKDTGKPPFHAQRFAYMDRVGPDMFSGRYDHGTCSTISANDAEHAEFTKGTSPPDVDRVVDKNHAYILTITPEGAESVCLYCGTTIEGCLAPGVKLDNMPWKEPFEKPRRANKREMKAMGITDIPEGVLVYFDKIEGPSYAGRFRVGECPEGGPHEALIHWTDSKTPVWSVCVFCGEQWHGPPPEFWDAALGKNRPTVECVVKQYEDDVRAGLV